MKIYLAGKIEANDWRHTITLQLRSCVYNAGEWKRVTFLTTQLPGVRYSGPFFVACDHGCAHGPNSHGAAGARGCVQGISRAEIIAKAQLGIRQCDLFIVYAGLDFSTAFGTLAEMGYAHALKKEIILIADPGLDLTEFWFVRGMAQMEIVSSDPADAIKKLLTYSSRTYRSLANLSLDLARARAAEGLNE